MVWLVVFLILSMLWFSYRYGWWKRTIDYKYPRILMYHMVRDQISRNKYNSLRVSPAVFEKQIKFLHDNGWKSYTMSEAIENRENLPNKSVIVTFDDGYSDNFINAFPILKKYNFKATIYLINNRRDCGLKYEPKLSDNDVIELVESGLIEIGAHTLTHINLSRTSDDESKKEICLSRKLIEKEFNIACKSFAYPFGRYKTNDKKFVFECGYTNAVTTQKGIADLRNCDLFEIPRVTISGRDSFFAFKIKLKTGKRGINK
jgi:peptidoglycan/xylan/chitin deacetylase (PgdA/CDA1 family)